MNGGPAGDLFLRIALLPHARLEVEGRDLRARVPISAWTAALGGEVRVPTLDGESTIKVPPGSSSGRKLRLKGKGLPGKGDERGDLYVEFRITVPEKLSKEQERLFKKLAATDVDQPAAVRGEEN